VVAKDKGKTCETKEGVAGRREGEVKVVDSVATCAQACARSARSRLACFHKRQYGYQAGTNARRGAA